MMIPEIHLKVMIQFKPGSELKIFYMFNLKDQKTTNFHLPHVYGLW